MRWKPSTRPTAEKMNDRFLSRGLGCGSRSGGNSRAQLFFKRAEIAYSVFIGRTKCRIAKITKTTFLFSSILTEIDFT